jgi:periplasmic divalent cation tolerance protein
MPQDPHAPTGTDRAATDRPSDVVALYLTFPNETTATQVSEALVERGLVACVNVLPSATSIFRWQGVVTREREVVAIAKTTADRLDAATAAVVELHPYELPCVVAYAATGGLGEYLQWVADETLAN